MTLSFSTTSRPYAQAAEAPAIDRLTVEGRSALLGMTWAAWYSSRPDDARRLLAGIGSEDALAAARAAGVTTEASLKLLRLRRLAAGDPDVMAMVNDLLAGTPVLHVPARLRHVVETTDGDRRRMLEHARADLATLPRVDTHVIAAVIAYLVGTEVDFAAATVREDPRARGFTRSILQALGLPFDTYMPMLRSWL
jgi:hypothetical protein